MAKIMSDSIKFKKLNYSLMYHVLVGTLFDFVFFFTFLGSI